MAHDESLSFSLRAGYPDFLDLPWKFPLSQWNERCNRIEKLTKEVSRHPVLFVNYSGTIYAIKEMPLGLSEKEYGCLHEMEEIGLPAVTPVGHVRKRTSEGIDSALITVYLDHSVPYHSLFRQRNLASYRVHILDAMASLLVQLHLSGVYWGDCSLSNTLFRRDAGALQAYLVDAETSEIRPKLSDGMRQNDLDIMQENVRGGVMDIAAESSLPSKFSIHKIGTYIHDSYQKLWNEITKEEILPPGKRYRIRERIKALNDLGFSVDEMKLISTEGGEQLRMRAIVTDRNFHRDLLNTLTGMNAGERQARQMINEIREWRVTLSESNRRSVPLSVAAFHWLNEVYSPTLERLREMMGKKSDLAERYCQILEHKWYLSERAHKDVGHRAAVDDFLESFLKKKSKVKVK